MNKKAIKTLEFDKICAQVSMLSVMDITKERILNSRVLTNLRKVNILQNETSEALKLLVKKGPLPIRVSGDVTSFLKRAGLGGVLSIGEIISVGKVLNSTKKVKDYSEEADLDTLKEHFDSLFIDEPLRKSIDKVFIDDETIADNASPELSDIRRKLLKSTDKIRETLQKIISGANTQKYLQENIITMRFDRYVVPVKSQYKGEIKGILHDTSSTGATLFIEPESVVEENNKIRELKVKEKEEIEKILMHFTNLIENSAKLIEMSYLTLSELDYIFARAKYALNTDSFKPKLNDKGIIDLKKARHPLIDPKKVVPTDIYLGRDFDTLVVTGPNTGGKTVVLKTVGLLTLMALSGLHIPAGEGSEVSVFENIFADIGDEQSIEQSLSTFSSHMVNIVEFLKLCDDKSFCLFDELGAGTDPVEGASLAMSILEKVRNSGAKSIATTHYSELKNYAMTTERIENASCEFDVNSLSPTYNLLIGVPGKSNAFAISKRLGLSDEIIENAKGYIDKENLEFEEILSKLEKDRLKAKKASEKAIKNKKETERLKSDIASKNKELTQKTDKIIEKALLEANQIIENAKKEADKLLNEFHNAKLESDRAKKISEMEKVRQKLSQKADENSKKIKTTSQKQYKSPKEVKLGEDVEVMTINQKGTVISLPDSKGDFYVRVGIMKILTNLKDVKVKKEENTQKTKTKVRSTSMIESKTMSLSPELDVRGETVDSAILLIDKFLDDAMLSSVGQLRIIHGKGTGLLRQGIHSYLKSLSYVKSYRLGVFGEGDSGVTIVEV